MILPSVERVHKISIVPRGRALGYTLNLPEEDRYLKAKDELIDHMVVLLAGRVAEHVVFGTVTTGASDDLKRVYELSRAMIAEYGMGTALMSRRLPADDYSVSDGTRRLVDDEQQHLTDMAWRRALEIILARRPLLDALATTLLEQEVLLRADIERIVGEEAAREVERRGEQVPSELAPLGGDTAAAQTPGAELPVNAARALDPLPHARTDGENAPEAGRPERPSGS